MVALRSLNHWTGAPGALVQWKPTAASQAAALAAPAEAIPPSRQQQQHLRAYRRSEAAGLPMARLITLVWDEPGQCDIDAMTEAFTAHLRRHDTYASHLSVDHLGRTSRHQIRDATAIALEPVAAGVVDADGWRRAVEQTPGPLDWDCFSFGVIQRADHFTVFAAVDHVHTDIFLVRLLFDEVRRSYMAAVAGQPSPPFSAATSYLDYCRRQEAALAGLTVDSPEIRAWLDVLAHTVPSLPTALREDPYVVSDIVTRPLLDGSASRRFELACAAAGARPLGGFLAVAAQAHAMLTGATQFVAMAPFSTRRADEGSTNGWFSGVTPVVLRDTARSFSELARTAQSACAERSALAHVPIERVLEVIPGALPAARAGVPMLSYLDSQLPPMDSTVMREWRDHDGRLFLNRGAAHQIGLWITRTDEGTTLSVAAPEDAETQSALDSFVDAMTDIAASVATTAAA